MNQPALSGLEPEVWKSDVDAVLPIETCIALSQAISLKRIADALQVQNVHGEPDTFDQKIEALADRIEAATGIRP